MAKINFGGVVQDARGKQNGIVYSKNKSGPYLRRKVTGVNPRTPKQTSARSLFGSLSQNWSAILDDPTRAAWTDFANAFPSTNVFGLAVPMNGLNQYVSINSVLANIGLPPIASPPASPATMPTPFESFTVDSSGPGLTINQPDTAPAGMVWYIYATPPLPPGRTAVPSDFRLVFTGAQTSTGTGPFVVDFSTEYAGIFGSPLVGQAVTILVSTVDPTIGVPTTGIRARAIAT